MIIKIYSTSKHPLPEYATPQAAGMDLRACIESPVTLMPGERACIPTGIHIQLPLGYEATCRGRSGIAIKKGIIAHVGTIDSDYRGDIGVILFNLSHEPFVIQDGDRIGQLVVSRHEIVAWEQVGSLDELTATQRGEGGYGHTGI